MPGRLENFDLTDLTDRESAARTAARDAAVSLVDDITDANVIVRDILVDSDLDSGTGNGWTTGSVSWMQSPTATGNKSMYKVDPNSNMKDKAIAIYGIKRLNNTPLATRIQFNKGAEGSGMGVKDIIDLEPGMNQESLVTLLQGVITYDPAEEGHIKMQFETTGTENIALLGVVAEKAGNNISKPEQ